MGKRLKIVIAIVALLLGGLTGFAGYIGYLGGPVFTDMPARGRSSAAHAHIAVALLSGDMGIRVGMGPRIATRLTKDGIPVVGVNSLTFFRHKRTPAEITALVETAVRRALAFGHADQVVLIGQSFGADMVHVGLAHMAPALRAKLRMVALVVPTDPVFFQASPSEMLDWGQPDAAALPTARLLNWLPVACVQGAEETDGVCPMLTQPNVRKVILPGGHPLHGDVDALHAALLRAIDAAGDDSANITRR